jgi:hypothetical protein
MKAMKISTALVGLSLALVSLLPAQSIGFGVKAGIPLTDVVSTTQAIRQGDIDMRRFTLGPVVDLRLPFGLGLETGALYKRFNQTGTTGMGGQITINQTGSSWEFPVLAKFRLPGILVRPYLEGGFVYNHLSDIARAFETAIRPTPAGEAVTSIGRPGFAAGAGLEVGTNRFRVVPGLRWTHYQSRDIVPQSNSVDFLVGLMF